MEKIIKLERSRRSRSFEMRDVQMTSLEKEIKGAARDTAATRANKMCATCVFLF